jgi:tetratricopeptide (TPR) repeat protein
VSLLVEVVNGRDALSQLPRFQNFLVEARLRLAHLCAAQRNWLAAAEEYRAILDQTSGHLDVWIEYASVLLLQENHEGYQQVCRRVLDRFGRSKKPEEQYMVARILALDPNKVSEPAETVQRAERAVAAFPRGGWYRHVLAVASYRAGRFDLAVEHCQQSMKIDPGWGGHVVNWLLLAMAHQRLGQARDAREWLDKAVRWIDQASQGKPKGADIDLPVPSWGDRLEIQLLQREAQSLRKSS